MPISTTRGYRSIYRFLVWVLFLSSSAGILYVGLLATKMRLSGDDYCLDAVLLREGLWGMVIRSYLEVSMYNGNRYSQIFFSGLAGLSPIWGNGLLVVIALIIWLVGLTYLVRWISQRLCLSLKLPEVLLIGLSYACFVLWSTQRLDQSVIWRSAMTAYFMPMVALTWLLIFIIWTAESKGLKMWQYAAILLTAILAAGFSETGAAFQAGSLGLVMILMLFHVKRKNGVNALLLPVIIALIGVFIGVALMYFSPVTELRRSSLPGPTTLNELLTLLVLNIRVYFWHSIMRRTLYLIIPFIFGFGLGLIHFVITPQVSNQALANFTWKHWVLFMVLVSMSSIFLVACVMLPATYVQGSYPPERALILAQSVLTMAGMLGGVLMVLCFNSIFNLTKVRALWFQNMVSGVSLVLILCVVVSPTMLITQNADKLPFYTRWSQLWELRHEELLAAGRMNQDEIHVIELDHIVSDVGELSPDPDYWYNNCAEMYYSIKSIYADLPGW